MMASDRADPAPSGARAGVTVITSVVHGDNPPIDGLWARPYGPPPNWARDFSGAPVLDDLHGAHRPRSAAGGGSLAQGQQQEASAAGSRQPRRRDVRTRRA